MRKVTLRHAFCGLLLLAALQTWGQADPLGRLVAHALTKEHGPQGPITTGLLGLTAPGQQLQMHQIKVEDGSDVHYFNVAADGSRRLTVFSKLENVVYGIAMDRNGTATAAVMRATGQPWQAVSVDSVRLQFHRMMGFWVDWANRNLRGN